MAALPAISAPTSVGTAPSSFARHLPTVARALLGLAFFVFGLNGFLNFIPAPKEGIPEGAMALGGAFAQSGYLMQLIKGTEVLCGVLLLLNLWVPLALTVLAPVLANIIAFHAFLAPSGLAIPGVLLALELYLGWAYRSAFRPMLAARVVPNT